MASLSAQSEEAASNHERLLYIRRRSGGGRHGGRARLKSTWRAPRSVELPPRRGRRAPRGSGEHNVRPALWPVEAAIFQTVLLCTHRGTRWRREDGECSRCMCFLLSLIQTFLEKAKGQYMKQKALEANQIQPTVGLNSTRLAV